MNVKWGYVIVFLVSVLISSVSQVILKSSTKKKHDNKLKEYLNPMVMGAYLMFFLATLMTTMAYRGVPLSFGPVLEATGYIYVAVLGRIILKEKVTKKKVAGNLLIIAGIVICSL